MDKKPATQESLISAIENAGRQAFEPTGDDASRSAGQREFGALISRTGTSSLISALNALIKPERVPRWLRVHLMDVLTLLPQRPGGVRATLEFVFATHPSSTVRKAEAAEPQKQGGNITMEAMKMAATMLSIPPNGVNPEKWYPGIAPQILALLDGNEGADLVMVAAYVIGYGVLGRKQLGAPGSPGWAAFAEPMLAAINPSLSSQKPSSETLIFSAGPDEVIDLQRETTAVKPEEIMLALQRLTALLNSHPNHGLTTRLLAPLVLPLWALSSWLSADEKCKKNVCLPARNLLQIYLKVSGSAKKYSSIINDMMYGGGHNSDGSHWRFDLSQSGIQVKRLRAASLLKSSGVAWESIESKAAAFVDLLEAAASDSEISNIFLMLFENSFGRQRSSDGIKLVAEEEKVDDPVNSFVKAKLLQQMMSKIPDKLVADSSGMLKLASRILAEFSPCSESLDATAIALSLVNIVVTAPSFQKSNVDSSLLESIKVSLHTISQANQHDVSKTASNLSLLLRYRDEIDDPSERPTAPSTRQIEDRKTFSLAISYITQAESPPPVRSEGLNLISGLIEANSPILDIQGVLVLLSSLLSDDEEYINLRAMRIFTQLVDKHPKSVIKELLEHCIDANEEATVDTRLRFGEAILQVIQRLGAAFSGETATQVSESLLSMAGRRGYRPKTEAKQAREERLRQRQQKAAEKEWGGVVPDLSEELEQTEEEKVQNDIVAQILAGWESKRGSEDVRMRASALSILSVGMETNIAGVGATLVETAVDLCVNILTMEPEMEKAIIRRAAIILILTFVKSLAAAKEQGRRLGFGLTDPSREDIMRILRYVSSSDNDGLVRQHASDVVESLQNWQLSSVLPEVRDRSPDLTRLAGLNINMPNLDARATVTRPRIEEIE
ncbi:uncharacterized protein BCR38DRAFT_392741 [Pseudomassariella vexata]|uniref:Armadillo-type protein n=1 Tax=Pseudomassariella vexata TaxID=1141098 RepID=A0A1Y2DY67_9PEZI|nr:uncharacterized protein BCR38DRAFT_392741 [Pseudomassariella vexata]ORY64193.1 hypothetical protein BCR38DRAFT_392741 [Pseudomassariella vexata]